MQQSKETKEIKDAKDAKDAKDKEKIRVFALARTLGVDSKIVIDLCKGLGFDVKSQLSSLAPDQVEQLKQRMAKGVGKPGPGEAPKPAPVKLPPTEKKIVHLKTPARPAETVRPVEPTPEPVETPVAPPVSEAPPLVEHAPAPAEVVETPVRPAPVVQEQPEVLPEPVVAPKSVVVDTPEPIAPPPVTPVAKTETPVPPAIPTVTASTETIPPSKAPVAPAAPSRPPTLAGSRMPNLSGKSGALPRPPAARPITSTPDAGPKPALTTAPPRPTTPAPTSGGTAPPRPVGTGGGPARPTSGTPAGSGGPHRPGGHGPGGRTGPGPAPGGPGTRPGGGGTPGGGGGPTTARGPAGPTTGQQSGGAGGQRHRRTDRDRQSSLIERRPGAGDVKKGPGQQAQPQQQKSRQFSAEELKLLRDGTTLSDLLKKKREDTPPPGGPPGVGTGKAGSPDGEGEQEGEDGKKKKAAGKDSRHPDRAKRQEQRKVRQTSVVVQGDGKVDLSEEQFGSKRSRARTKIPKKKLQSTLPPKDSTIFITSPITIRSLSEAIGMKVGELMIKLKQLTNTLYTVNSTIDFDVAELIATEKNLVVQLKKAETAEEAMQNIHKKELGDESKLEPRAPVVTIMGHVDHGKTSLLDKIRASNVVATEAGGITQVIRAWRVEHNGKPITFLDTPGHEAFTKMRARGANVTDVAVIVVAANDGVMPQTEEAIAHAKAAGVSIVVAINKVDLPDANIKRTEQQLYGLGLLPDTMGGDVQFVYTSASKGTGISELLDTLSLVAEMKELKANPHKLAAGICLEAHLSGDEGVKATLLVQQGTLHKGDVILCGATYGRVRAMYDDFGRAVTEAGPSMPVVISGLDEVPNADDHFHAVTELAKAREIADRRRDRALEATFKPRTTLTLEQITEAGKPKITELKVVLKAEARGSIEAIRKELEKLVHEEVRVRILHAGIGAITESDVQLGLASPDDSLVVGFNVVPDDNALRLADEHGIKIRQYEIIYKLTEDIKSALEGKLKPREEVVNLGRAVVKQTFKVGRVGTIAGCHVTHGIIERSSKIRVIRDGSIIFPSGEKTASLESLKHYKNDVREIKQGFECGMKIANYDDIKVGDVIEAYRIDHIQRTL